MEGRAPARPTFSVERHKLPSGPMKPRPGFVFLLLLPFLNFAGGCAGVHPPLANHDSQQLYTVTATSTAFYTHSPRQGGPDQRLPKDTLLHLIRYSPSFAKVALLEGPTGYVLTDDIAPCRRTVTVGTATVPALAGSPQTPADVAEVPSRVPEPPLPEFEPPPLPAPSN
jgi:hypothetical protein